MIPFERKKNESLLPTDYTSFKTLHMCSRANATAIVRHLPSTPFTPKDWNILLQQNPFTKLERHYNLLMYPGIFTLEIYWPQ